MIISIISDKLDIVKYLVEQGANIEYKESDGFTPLKCSTLRNRCDIIKYLISVGADYKTKDRLGMTPIDLCDDKQVLLNIIRLTKLKELYNK